VDIDIRMRRLHRIDSLRCCNQTDELNPLHAPAFEDIGRVAEPRWRALGQDQTRPNAFCEPCCLSRLGMFIR
jgi:hypothetical protein